MGEDIAPPPPPASPLATLLHASNAFNAQINFKNCLGTGSAFLDRQLIFFFCLNLILQSFFETLS